MTSRDPDSLIRAYLDEGIGELPDRVMDAIASDIHVTRQRARPGPWRLFTMSRLAIGAAVAVIAVVIAGTAWLGLFRPSSSVGGQTPAPSTLSAVASAPASSVGAPATSAGASTVPSTAPVTGDLAVGSPFPVRADVITAGQTYHSVGFSAPLAFTMPLYPTRAGTQYSGETWNDGHTLRIKWDDGNAVTVHDGIKISNDVCHPTSVVDVPANPYKVGQWLHASAGVAVNDLAGIRLTSGAFVKVFDIALGKSCFVGADGPPGGPPIWFSAGEVHRLYAVQDGSRTVLLVTWPGSNDVATMNADTDRLVQSLQFP